jgi:HPt (histidine-containing phosphotransfer) domain-containing protein
VSGNFVSKDIKDSLDAAIAKVRLDFIKRLGTQFSVLEELANQFEREPRSRPALEQLATEAHKIAGIAKSVGFPRLGDCAKESEEAVREFLASSNEAVADSVAEKIDSMLEEIENAVVAGH